MPAFIFINSSFLLFLFSALLSAQPAQDARFQASGACGRCHVVSVLEWGGSKHFRAGTGCTQCHGVSEGHVVDERNNIKPEKIPHGAAIAGLCADCHAAGCPKSQRKEACDSCHHVHALADPKRPVDTRNPAWEALTKNWDQAKALAREGAALMDQGKWQEALARLKEARALNPGEADVVRRIKACERRLKPGLPGFEIAGSEFDRKTGLPRQVVVRELGLKFALVPGGQAEIGSAHYADATPVHEVRVEPFYMAVTELTQAAWAALTGRNPSAFQGSKYPNAARMPVENVSWEDCREALAQLNSKVPGGGFRLPTEAEWELAARDGGESAADAFELEAPREAGAGKPNRFGIYDLRGNVWEWCSSLYAPYPYAAQDGREAKEAKGLRVLRGGGFADGKAWFDASARFGERPDRRLRTNGVRLVRSVPQ